MKREKPMNGNDVLNDDCCGLCDLTYADIALDRLEEHWDNPPGLIKAMKELYRDGYEQYAKPLLWRMEKLRPGYAGLEPLRQAINDRVFWRKRISAESRMKVENERSKK